MEIANRIWRDVCNKYSTSCTSDDENRSHRKNFTPGLQNFDPRLVQQDGSAELDEDHDQMANVLFSFFNSSDVIQISDSQPSGQDSGLLAGLFCSLWSDSHIANLAFYSLRLNIPQRLGIVSYLGHFSGVSFPMRSTRHQKDV